MIRSLGVACVLVIGLVASVSASAHERTSDRRVILDVDEATSQALVSWTLPAGAEADRLRTIADANGDGTVRSPTEQLARAMLVVPRMLDGLVVHADGEPVELTLTDLHIRDGAADGRRRGLEAMAIVALPIDPALADGVATIELTVAFGDGHVIVEAQARGDFTIVEGSLPDRGGPVRGPATLHAGESVSVVVERATAP